jgi:hypothetical protein
MRVLIDGIFVYFSITPWIMQISTEPLAKLAVLGDLIAGTGKMEGRGCPFLA